MKEKDQHSQGGSQPTSSKSASQSPSVEVSESTPILDASARFAEEIEGPKQAQEISAESSNRSDSGTAPLKDDDILISPSSPHLFIPSPVSASRDYSLILDGPRAVSPVIIQAPTGPQTIHKVAGVGGAPKGEKKTPNTYKRMDQLNWFSWDELEANGTLLSDKQNRFLRVANTKRTQYQDGFDKGNYFENIYPLIVSNYTKSEKIVYCGNILNGKKVPCHQWAFCSKCAYVTGMESSLMYAPAFSETNFFHLTCSFNGHHSLGSTNYPVMQDYWEANEAAVRHLLKSGWIDGACVVHELALHSFVPVRVVPHSHVVITADRISPELKPALVDFLTNQPGIEMPPSIDVRLIDHQRGLDRVLKYQTEAIDIKQAYDTAWHNQVDTDRKGAIELNQQLKEFLESYGASIYGFPRVIRMGNLRPGTKSYIGKLQKELRKASKRKRAKAKKQRS
ncbi:hypothetical protein DES53_103192 [Roseimicrobium gellanilyticum]|uniref:Uncharacterized protein n=1 Tax=Roseimicrobium gellanilyticum TaxID=748857 RepID=A0A366HQ04_9BACT|nr:hypothetical protein [Roseimicrobium gellanilyticum]RBP45194.1 hypothetical protein DES53_103192 [Roseimicrobium gellanilyticum]